MNKWCNENLFSINAESLTMELKVIMAPRPTNARTAMNS